MYRKLLLLLFLILNFYGCNQNKTDISFEKITLYTSMCLGTCPIYHLEIDNDKQIKLFVEEFYIEESFEKDLSRIGYFTGKLSEKEFLSLMKLLESIDFNESKTIENHCCDGSLKTISIYYNGKIKVIETMFPSEKTRAIVSFLIDVCEKDQLIKTNEKFVI